MASARNKAEATGSSGAAAASGAAATAAPQGSSLGRSVRSTLARLTPTNYNMLLFRTINRDLGHPNANDDYIAPMFRERLMPLRSWVQRSVPGMLALTRRGVEHPDVGVPGVCNFVDARTKWMDEALKQALDEGVTQVVCMAAGYDTRAYRFARQGVKFFEVDLPTASKRKQALVKACLSKDIPRPTFIAADLSKVTLSQALAGSGFDPDVRTFFSCEGLIYYLPEAAVANLIASVADLAASGSRLMFDFLHSDAVDGSASYVGFEACQSSVTGKGEAFISGLVPERDDMGAYLAPLGWRLARLWSPQQMVAAQLPHLRWSDEQPPICPFYSFAAVERLAPEEEEEEAAAAVTPQAVVAPSPPVSKPVPAGLAHSASAPPSFQIKASAGGKAD
ncbi:S-adenosyl-L-methionine-dependent methyltransferase [Chlorella sorokiniana]|uniref:S-adenosyl-L-methionine-dependent methyltransferase n=1 Tax=Chlorella sorokiniana TaxID=3076 RepID=A0A2P6TH36_CHLSO|nr:S-adenosyl-L-methionine-dependent methyltransferase [Chlorella sorokiniana]|eukprot:PRW33609.1 S-adenosyl-L-methionine-dependent methyltransferase [Chlorella sorokiniana]